MPDSIALAPGRKCHFCWCDLRIDKTKRGKQKLTQYRNGSHKKKHVKDAIAFALKNLQDGNFCELGYHISDNVCPSTLQNVQLKNLRHRFCQAAKVCIIIIVPKPIRQRLLISGVALSFASSSLYVSAIRNVFPVQLLLTIKKDI